MSIQSISSHQGPLSLFYPHYYEDFFHLLQGPLSWFHPHYYDDSLHLLQGSLENIPPKYSGTYYKLYSCHCIVNLQSYSILHIIQSFLRKYSPRYTVPFSCKIFQQLICYSVHPNTLLEYSRLLRSRDHKVPLCTLDTAIT